jgi:RND family efflux transporter MFP subunit
MILEKKIPSVCAFVIVLTFTFADLSAQPGRGPAAVAVGKVAQVRRAGLETFVGSLQPMRRSTVGSAVDGRVISMEVERGDPVTADPNRTNNSETFVGQPVMQLRTGTLEIEIGSAEILLKLAQQAFDELTVSLPREIELANAKAAEAQARLQYSKDAFDRAARLGGSSGAISEGELELSRSQYLADQEAARGATIDLERLKSTRDLRLLQLTLRIESGKQELERLHDLKAKYTIRAPFEGLVTEKLTEVGEWVTQGQAVVEIVQLNPIEMIINTPQEHIGRIQQSLGAASEAHPLIANIEIDGYDHPLEGTVKRIIAKADLRSRTFPVRIEIQNPPLGSGYALQPGMLGRASLMIGVEQDMTMVKKDALVLGGAQTMIFKVAKQGEETVALGVPVKMGASLGEWIQVIGDITVEDQVVLLGNERLRSGQAIKISRVIDETPE